MNDENLKNGKKTQFNGETAAKAGSKGGKATAAKRKAKLSLKETVCDVLNMTYTDSKGNQKRGVEVIAANLLKIATDPKHRDCINAIKLVREILGENIDPEAVKQDKKKVELLESQIELNRKKAEDITWE